MNIKDALDFIKTTPLHNKWLVEDLRDCLWAIDDTECDLFWEDEGEVYSAEVSRGERIQIDNLIFINANNSWGDSLTYIFDINKQQPVGVLND